MKKMVVLVGMLVVLFGCSSDKSETTTDTSASDTSYNQMMQKAKEAIVEKEFEKAEGYVELALEDKKDDDEAKSFKVQLNEYIEATSKKETDKNQAKDKFEEVTKIDDGSTQLVNYAKDEIAQLEKDIKKDTKTTTSNSSGTTKKEEDGIWNPKKDKRLYDFMMSWGETMKQDYKQYNASSSVDLYGLKLPEAVLNGSWTMVVNNAPVSVEWSTNGEGTSDYELVAVYSDADTQPYLEKHVYFFVFQSGTPKVLVTQQNQGNSNNYIYFKQSENADLTAGYTSIATNQ